MAQYVTELAALRGSMQGVRQRLGYEEAGIERLTAKMALIESEKVLLVRTVGLIDRAIAAISAQGIGKVEATVTNGLALAFGDTTMSFKVLKKEGTRGNSYELVVSKMTPDGEVVGPIMDTFGGGVANVVSFLLRVLMIKRFKTGKFLILDESFNNVSASRLPMVSELLRTLAHDGGYTIFAVTHQPILACAADNVYRAVEIPDAPPILQKLTPAQQDEMRRESGIMAPAPTPRAMKVPPGSSTPNSATLVADAA